MTTAPALTVPAVRAAFRRYEAQGHDPDRLAVYQAFVTAIVQGMDLQAAADLCGVRILSGPSMPADKSGVSATTPSAGDPPQPFGEDAPAFNNNPHGDS